MPILTSNQIILYFQYCTSIERQHKIHTTFDQLWLCNVEAIFEFILLIYCTVIYSTANRATILIQYRISKHCLFVDHITSGQYWLNIGNIDDIKPIVPRLVQYWTYIWCCLDIRIYPLRQYRILCCLTV
jgi:hypothetical protein